MHNNLILFRNELKNKTIYKYKLIGIFTELIFSKQLFSKNSDLNIFIKEIFKIEFKNYILKSRTMISSKVNKILILSSDDDIYRKELIAFIDKAIEDIKNDENFKSKKNEFDGWIK